MPIGNFIGTRNMNASMEPRSHHRRVLKVRLYDWPHKDAIWTVHRMWSHSNQLVGLSVPDDQLSACFLEAAQIRVVRADYVAVHLDRLLEQLVELVIRR